MSSVTLAQIFNIVNGPEDYINVNISLAQCIKSSLAKISDVIDYTNSPFNTDMIYDSSSNDAAVDTTSFVEFTSRMDAATDTFITACNSALQTARESHSSTVSDFSFLYTTFAGAQSLFLAEYQNYIIVYNFLFTRTGTPTWNSSGTSVVTTAIQNITPTDFNNSFRPDFVSQWMNTAQLRIIRRILTYTIDCYQTVSIIIAPTDSKYNGNTSYSSSAISTITSNFVSMMSQISTISNEGSDLVDAFDDWENLAREGSGDITTVQTTIVTELATFVTSIGTLRTTIATLNTALAS